MGGFIDHWEWPYAVWDYSIFTVLFESLIFIRTTLVISWFDIHSDRSTFIHCRWSPSMGGSDHSTYPYSTFIRIIQYFLIRHSFRPFNISWFDVHSDHSTFPDSTFIQTIQHFLIRHSFRPFNISWFDIHSDHLTFHDSTFIQTIQHSFIAGGPPPWGVQTIDISLFDIH